MIAGKSAGADWYAIEQEYKTTGITLSALALKHGVAYDTLRKRCAKQRWRAKARQFCAAPDDRYARDSPELEPELRDPAQGSPAHPKAIPLHRALVAYVNTRHQPGSEQAYSERAILEGAALQLEMIREHRGDIRTARELALTLLNQLVAVSGNREAILAAINELEDNSARRAALSRAVALPVHISAMRDLSTTLRQLIPLERQALGIADSQPIEPIDPRDPGERVGERPELAELEAAIEAQLLKHGVQVPRSE